MKRLSISRPALALAAVLFLCSAAAPVPTSHAVLASVASSHPAPAAFLNGPAPTHPYRSFMLTRPAHYDYIYYWYSAPDDAYIDHQTLADEEFEWWLMLWGVEVDSNPMGGSLLARGYMQSNYPHIAFPMIYLYAHYTN
jgi:hypothetical protein